VPDTQLQLISYARGRHTRSRAVEEAWSTAGDEIMPARKSGLGLLLHVSGVGKRAAKQLSRGFIALTFSKTAKDTSAGVVFVVRGVTVGPATLETMPARGVGSNLKVGTECQRRKDRRPEGTEG